MWNNILSPPQCSCGTGEIHKFSCALYWMTQKVAKVIDEPAMKQLQAMAKWPWNQAWKWAAWAGKRRRVRSQEDSSTIKNKGWGLVSRLTTQLRGSSHCALLVAVKTATHHTRCGHFKGRGRRTKTLMFWEKQEKMSELIMKDNLNLSLAVSLPKKRLFKM